MSRRRGCRLERPGFHVPVRNRFARVAVWRQVEAGDSGANVLARHFPRDRDPNGNRDVSSHLGTRRDGCKAMRIYDRARALAGGRRLPLVKVGIVIALLLVVGLGTVGDQGVSTDERDDALAIYWNLRLLETGQPIPNNVAYYGTVFPFVSEAVFQVRSLFENGALRSEYFTNGGSTHDLTARVEFRERILTKHILTFLFSLLAYASAAGLVGILSGANNAWLGPILLALIPRFWGETFFNPRDIPFAIMFTVGSLLGALLVGHYLRVPLEGARVGRNRTTVYSLLYGVIVGLCTGTRSAGFLLLAFVAIAHLVASIGQKARLKDLLRFSLFYGLAVGAWAATVIAIHPASWAGPVQWFNEGLGMLSRHTAWDGSNLFNGRYIPGMYTPWYYLPVWLMITTPEFIQVTALGGALVFLFTFRRLRPVQQAAAVLLVLQIAFLPGLAVLRDSTLYNGLRQFLFLLPAVAVVAASGWAWLLSAQRPRILRVSGLLLLPVLSFPVIADMVALHPYEYIYFNRTFGGLPAAYNRFETDYFGLSLREGMEWINRASGSGARVVAGRAIHSAEAFAEEGILVASLAEYAEREFARPFYYIARPHVALQQRFPECPIVHGVTRQDVPLTIVKLCE